MLWAIARNVCGGAVERVGAPAGTGEGPHGHQAAVYRATGRGVIFRLGIESYIRASGNRTAHQFAGAGLLLVAELCAVSVDAGGRHRETAGGNVAGVAGREGHERGVLDVAVWRAVAVDNGRRQGGA